VTCLNPADSRYLVALRAPAPASKRAIFGLGEADRPDQQGPRRIEAPRSDIRRKPLGATLLGLGRLHRLDEQRVDEKGNGRSGFSVLRSRRASRKGAELRHFGCSLLLWDITSAAGLCRKARLRRAAEASSGNGRCPAVRLFPTSARRQGGPTASR